jgi:hypothetical protein
VARRRFLGARHVAPSQSADMSAQSKGFLILKKHWIKKLEFRQGLPE